MKTLMIGTYINAPYHPFQEVDRVLISLLGPQTEATDDFSRLLTMEKEGYSLCVSYIDRFDSALPDGAADAILTFVRHGGGLMCLHNGISLQTDERLYHLIGGKFAWHPPQTDIAFSAHPAGFLSGMAGFVISEEPYQFEMSGDEVFPLLTYRYDGKEYPGGWCRTEEKGRVVFLTPGHSIASFKNKEYLDMIRKSAEWAAEKR